ncbi:MAG TPA: PilZ domain-containing protein [Candidatus Deferrimicrobiaceae bacterium]
MMGYGRERRGSGRAGKPDTEVVFVVREGKEPARVSSPVTARLRDLSLTGMSVQSPRLAPNGIHIMYDTLMVVRNRIEAEVRPPGGKAFNVSGSVIWFRADENLAGAYLFGMTFDTPLPPELLPAT